MTAFINGVTAYFKAFGIISEMRLWKYLLIPGIISLLLGGGIAAAAYGFSGSLGALLIAWWPFQFGLTALTKIAGVIAGVLIVVSSLIIYKHIIMVLISPFMTPLAQKVEDNLRGVERAYRGFDPQQAVTDILRGLRIAFRNIFREMFYVLLLLPINLIPGFGSLISTLGIFLVQSFYAGFGNMDYVLERHFNVRKTVSFVRANRGLAIGNGSVYMLLLMTGFGFLFAPPLATIAATVESVKLLHPHTDDAPSNLDDAYV